MATKRQRARLYAAVIDGTTGKALRGALAAYEATGDHDHGSGPIAPGGPCGFGDDCWVRRARAALAALRCDRLTAHGRRR